MFAEYHCIKCHTDATNTQNADAPSLEGTDTGTKIRLRGQGGHGSRSGPPGDLLINFVVQSDRFYGREGLDLVARVPINIAQATLGSKVNVRTVDGKKVSIRIPPGTPSGKRFRVRGQGVNDMKGGERYRPAAP